MAGLMAGAGVGALASELLKVVIKEAKKVLAFKYVSKELASTMEDLLPIITQIESRQKDDDDEELKKLMVTIERARVLVLECLDVKWWDPVTKRKYTSEIEVINKDMLKFCQVQLQLIMHRNQMQSTVEEEAAKSRLEIIEKKLDLLSVPAVAPHVFRDSCSVPEVDKVIVGLDWQLTEVKEKLLDDAVDILVVSAPPGSGKTTLVTQLCHDEDIKGKFKHIFFNVVSSAPNFRVILQNLLQQNGYDPFTFDNDFQATVEIRKLMEELIEDGPILMVLDDVWHGAEFFLENFRINLPSYKILVTSWFDFPSFGPTYHLKPLEGEVEVWSKEEALLGPMLQHLQPSFNVLESHLKECFMDMGSFLEDKMIRASVIIDMWLELYDQGSSSVYMKYLHDLASHNLLKLENLWGNELEDYTDWKVTQHDVLRELAICQTKSEEKHEIKRKRLNLEIRKNEFPDWCLDLTQPIDARLLSISTDDLFSSSWVEMDCPNVEALVLNLSSSNYVLPNFIATMKKLKVVIIIHHGHGFANLTNLSCLGSLPNLKRIRLQFVLISMLDILHLQLGRLKKLSLVLCWFSEVQYDAMENINVSKSLRGLEEIEIDSGFGFRELPYWIYEVVSLKTLSITRCLELSSLSEGLGNLSNLEVLRLSSCYWLSKLPETMKRLSELRFLDISDCLELIKLPLEIEKLRKLKKISMDYQCDLPDSMKYRQDLEVKWNDKTLTMSPLLRELFRE